MESRWVWRKRIITARRWSRINQSRALRRFADSCGGKQSWSLGLFTEASYSVLISFFLCSHFFIGRVRRRQRCGDKINTHEIGWKLETSAVLRRVNAYNTEHQQKWGKWSISSSITLTLIGKKNSYKKHCDGNNVQNWNMLDDDGCLY